MRAADRRDAGLLGRQQLRPGARRRPAPSARSAPAATRLPQLRARTDGTLACWGDNATGRPRRRPARFTAVSAGGFHSCALRTDGTLACWGDNSTGRPTPPTGTFTAVSAGGFHSCGLRTDGTLACWGVNSDGQLGAAPATPGPAPASPAFVGLAYSHAFSSASGIPAAGFAVTAGSLPDDLALSADGVLSGTPTSAGTFDFTVTASNGLFADASQSFSITVIDDSSPPAVAPTPPAVTPTVPGATEPPGLLPGACANRSRGSAAGTCSTAPPRVTRSAAWPATTG